MKQPRIGPHQHGCCRGTSSGHGLLIVYGSPWFQNPEPVVTIDRQRDLPVSTGGFLTISPGSRRGFPEDTRGSRQGFPDDTPASRERKRADRTNRRRRINSAAIPRFPPGGLPDDSPGSRRGLPNDITRLAPGGSWAGTGFFCLIAAILAINLLVFKIFSTRQNSAQVSPVWNDRSTARRRPKPCISGECLLMWKVGRARDAGDGC